VVRRRRHELHIPPCGQQLTAQRERRRQMGRAAREDRYTPEEDALLGTMSDREAAKLMGRSWIAVQGRRNKLKIPKFDAKLHQWTADEDALLGTMTDGALAARLGLTLSAVAHRRRRLKKAGRFAHRRPWTPEEDALLGTATDTEIAKRLDRHLATVCIRRQKLGIPNLHWQQRCGRQRVFANA